MPTTVTVIGVPTGPFAGLSFTVRSSRKPPFPTCVPFITAKMSCRPPKSFGTLNVTLNAPLESVVAFASATPILSTLRPM